jgi:iron(III) transport system permease protein
VLSTRIYLLSTPEARAPDYGTAAAFGIGLLVVAALLMWGYFRATRVSERFRVVTGKGFRPRRLRLGRWRYPALAFVAGYFALMLAPVAALLWTSLQPFARPPSLEALGSLSLDNYQSIVQKGLVQRAIVNTLILVFGSATLTMLLSALVSWFALRSKAGAARWLDVLAFAPLAIPGIVLALAILMMYIRTPLYGTIWIIVLAHVTTFLAFGTRTMNGALIQIHPELENAAIASGASWSTTLRQVLLPMLWPQFLNGWLWVVAHSIRDLTMPLMLMSTGNLVLSSALWLLWSGGDVTTAAALLMLMVLGLLVLVLPLQIHASAISRERS